VFVEVVEDAGFALVVEGVEEVLLSFPSPF
jgi:hypothetical protein